MTGSGAAVPMRSGPAEVGHRALGWRVESVRGSAADFHARPFPEPLERTVWVFEVTAPAVVVGSAQPLAHVDQAVAAAAGVEVVRRRSGGGAVLLVPGEVVWIDVLLPRTDPLWDDDIGRATRWLGAVWATVLGSFGIEGIEVHTGGLVRTPWSDRVCFAGLGPGEVTVGGRKIVGISQRRVRAGARFQTAMLRRWDPTVLAAIVAPDAAVAPDVPLANVAVGLDELVEARTASPLDRFLAALPS